MTHSNHYKPSQSDFENLKFQNMFKNSLNEVKCLNPACNMKIFSTWILVRSENDRSASVFWPAAKKTLVTYVSGRELIDFVVSVRSCIGIWFGVSFYSIYDGILTFHTILFKRSRTNTTPTLPTGSNQSLCHGRNIPLSNRCNYGQIPKLKLEVKFIRNLVKQLFEMVKD